MPEPYLKRAYLPELDGLRAIAVILVVLAHAVPVPSTGLVAWGVRNTLSNGWLGVDLFFALSGFLITSILLAAKTGPHYFRNFYARRALRIFPLYYAVIAILALASARMPFGPARPLWPYLAYVSNFWSLFSGHEWEPLGHVWSLAIEEQFYLVYPAVAFLLEARGLRTLMISVIAISPVIRLITNAATRPGASYFMTFTRLDSLAMGALVALMLQEPPQIREAFLRRARRVLPLLVALSLVLWVTKQLDFRKPFFNAVGLTVIDAALACLICVVIGGGMDPLDRFLRRPFLIAIGKVSYGIYLLHYPVSQLVASYARQRLADDWWRTAVIAVSSVGLTAGLSALSWVALERPFLRLKRFFYEPGLAVPMEYPVSSIPTTRLP